MRKALILFFILLVVMPTLAHAQSAKDALMALKKLQARTQAGISYKDYSNAVGEAKFPLNMFLESNDAQKYPELSTSFKKVMAHYQYAGLIWDPKLKGLISKKSTAGNEIARLYPNAGDAVMPKVEDYYYVPFLLKVIWGEASKELDNATKLYAKLEEKLSDDTAKKSDDTETLKKEIAELKEEVERLKKENDLLRNPQKVK